MEDPRELDRYLNLLGAVITAAAVDRFWPAEVPRKIKNASGNEVNNTLTPNQLKAAKWRAYRWWVAADVLPDEEWELFRAGKSDPV